VAVERIRIPEALALPRQTEQLRATLEAYLEGMGRQVQLDLTEIEYLGSSTIAVLLTFLRKLQERDGKAEILVGSDDVLRTLTLTRVDQLVPVTRT